MLYGWGEGEDDDQVEHAEDECDNELDDGVDVDNGKEAKITQDAVRFTVQSGSDFYLVDKQALIEQHLR